MKDVSKEIENAHQHKEIKEYYKDFEDEIDLWNPKEVMRELEECNRKTKYQFESYDDAYFYAYPYYYYLRNNANKEQLYKKYGIKQMPKFTPSPLLLKVYKRFKNVYEMKDKENQDKEIYYKLLIEDTNKMFEPEFQKLKDEYKAGTKRKTTINKEYNQLLKDYRLRTKSTAEYTIPLKEN